MLLNKFLLFISVFIFTLFIVFHDTVSIYILCTGCFVESLHVRIYIMQHLLKHTIKCVAKKTSLTNYKNKLITWSKELLKEYTFKVFPSFNSRVVKYKVCDKFSPAICFTRSTTMTYTEDCERIISALSLHLKCLAAVIESFHDKSSPFSIRIPESSIVLIALAVSESGENTFASLVFT